MPVSGRIPLRVPMRAYTHRVFGKVLPVVHQKKRGLFWKSYALRRLKNMQLQSAGEMLHNGTTCDAVSLFVQ